MGSSSENGATLEAERNVPPSAEIIKNRKREGRGRDYCFSATLAIIWKLSWHSAIICSITTANSRGMSLPDCHVIKNCACEKKTQSSLICERQGGTVTSNHPLFRFKLSDPCVVFHVSIKIQSPNPRLCDHIACLLICLPITHSSLLSLHNKAVVCRWLKSQCFFDQLNYTKNSNMKQRLHEPGGKTSQNKFIFSRDVGEKCTYYEKVATSCLISFQTNRNVKEKTNSTNFFSFHPSCVDPA